MPGIEKDLPEFKNPPLSEVALSVQFEPIEPMRTVHLGLLWTKFREEFPTIEEQPPLPSVLEQFGVKPGGAPEVTFSMTANPTPNRHLFLNQEGTQLVQVQRDRLVHNWRKVGDNDTYPRYEKIRDVFLADLKTLSSFLKEEALGEVVPNQVELSYVDHLVAGAGWTSHADLDKVITIFRRDFSDNFLTEPEQAEVTVRFVMRDDQGRPAGRLHVAVQPMYRRRDETPVYVLRLTARGRPSGTDTASVIEYMDRARGWIVRGFTSITTPEMHLVWQRQDRSR